MIRTLATLVELLIFVCGLLLGAQFQDMVHEQERRRWLVRNHALKSQVERLEDMATYASACEEDMRWHSKQQSGLAVIEYEEDGDEQNKAS